jgi:hypothetical protein
MYLMSCGLLIALMMEAASTSETSVNFYQTKRLNIPEYIHLRQSIYQEERCSMVYVKVEVQLAEQIITKFPLRH